MDEVLFLAVGGYNRTYELLLAMGLEKEEIATFSNLNLTQSFLAETHEKKVVYIRKINYLTSVLKGTSYSRKWLDLNVADAFEESMMIYKNAERTLTIGRRRVEWMKPTIVVLDDQSLNLQYEGHRFLYQNEIGFVQMRNRNADPQKILEEIQEVEEADHMMFALYQENGVDESEILDALNRLQDAVSIRIKENWYMKPTVFKKLVGSQKLGDRLKEIPDLGIYQLTSNKKIQKQNARWIVIPDQAFAFSGFDYKDEADLFQEQLAQEEQTEASYEAEQERRLQQILTIELPLNIKIGFVGKEMQGSPVETLDSFLADIDEIEAQEIHGIELLHGATTEDEYKHIKKYHLAYFLDGSFKDGIRKDEHYLGGKRLIAIDVDDGEYTREELEARLESQDLFGVVYPTAKYYFNHSNRWRILLMADKEMTKEQYREVVAGTANMLAIEIDDASKKISQLMGYPLASEDVSTVIGTMVHVDQFLKKGTNTSKKVVSFPPSAKSLMDFDHVQAKLLKEVLTRGVPEGKRNETYRQVYLYLKDTLEKPELEAWHQEAAELIKRTKAQAALDGLPEKEVEMIYR